MCCAVAEPGRQRKGALQVLADVALVGKAHRAVQLDRFTGDEQCCVRTTGLRPTRRKRARPGIVRAVERAHGIVDRTNGKLLLHP
jgi:hypothetical protein